MKFKNINSSRGGFGGGVGLLLTSFLVACPSWAQEETDQGESKPVNTVTKLMINRGGLGTLEFDNSSGRQSIDLFTLIHRNGAVQGDSRMFAKQSFLFKMDQELWDKIRAQEEADSIAYGKLYQSLKKESEDREREFEAKLRSGEISPDGPEWEEYFAPFAMLDHDYFELRRSRARDLAEMMNEEQIAGLRKGAMDAAVREFGGMFELYKKALAQSGVDPNEGVTPEQKKRIVDALSEYRIKLRELNAELFEKVLAELPPAQRDALLDAASIRELKK